MNITEVLNLIKKDSSVSPQKIPLKNYIIYGKAGVCGACGACGACGPINYPETKELPKVKVKKL